MKYERELAVAQEAARAAGQVVSRWYDGDYTVRHKGHDSPVTEADTEANQAIHTLISRSFPQDGWLSEETRDSDARLSKQRVWVVDPLDGTKEFINHIPEFCVCVALVEGDEAVVGVSYNPVADEMFAAAQGGGATLNGAPVRVSTVTDVGAACFLASRSESARGEWAEFQSRLRVKLTGSVAYKLSLIAAGRGDATFSLKPKNEWDICAGTALITAGGGRITDRYGLPLRFNQRSDTLLPGIIASNGGLHAPIMEILRGHGYM
jgi:myo-inositol-1(or 4)-monophosphatase